MKKFLVGILSALMLVGIGASPVKANAPVELVGTYTYDFSTYDNGMNGLWAKDNFHSTVKIYQLPKDNDYDYKVVREDTGTFEVISGAKTPGGDGETVVGDGTKGTIIGGETVYVNGSLKEVTSPVGPKDWTTDERSGDWYDLENLEKIGSVPYYEPFFNSENARGSFIADDWGWTYMTCNNGTWIDNAETESAYPEGDVMGDITGAYVPCAQPVVVSQPLSQAGAPVCSAFAPAMIQHAIAKRINATNSVVSYWPTVTGGQVNIRFREEGAKDWQHALRDFPNLGVAPIGFLKENVKYEYQITNGHGCAQSNWSPVFRSL